MPVLYVTEPGATVRKTSERLVVTKDGAELASIPALHVEQVLVFGPAQVTTQALAFLLERGVDVGLLSSRGKYFGRLVGAESSFGELRLHQYRAACDPARCLALARSFVRGKLRNQRTFLLRRARREPAVDLAAPVAALDRCLERIETVSDLDGLRGLEGHGSGHYFAGLRRMLKQDLGFRSRVRRPPTDPVNSLLSFGYTLLSYNVQAAIQTVGLDPYLGFLHAPERTRPSLVLDLVEEFRSLIVDSLVVELINERVVTATDFEPDEEGGPGIFLTERSRRAFLAHFERRLQTRVTYGSLPGPLTYRRCFEGQARQLARVLRGVASEYHPLLAR